MRRPQQLRKRARERLSIGVYEQYIAAVTSGLRKTAIDSPYESKILFIVKHREVWADGFVFKQKYLDRVITWRVID